MVFTTFLSIPEGVMLSGEPCIFKRPLNFQLTLVLVPAHVLADNTPSVGTLGVVEGLERVAVEAVAAGIPDCGCVSDATKI